VEPTNRWRISLIFLYARQRTSLPHQSTYIALPQIHFIRAAAYFSAFI